MCDNKIINCFISLDWCDNKLSKNLQFSLLKMSVGGSRGKKP